MKTKKVINIIEELIDSEKYAAKYIAPDNNCEKYHKQNVKALKLVLSLLKAPAKPKSHLQLVKTNRTNG